MRTAKFILDGRESPSPSKNARRQLLLGDDALEERYRAKTKLGGTLRGLENTTQVVGVATG